jgi:hypothetical protein
MPTQAIALIIKVFPVIVFAGLLSAALPATPCRGSDRTADRTITLDVQNEPLRSVLERISKATGWKIIVPDRWMDKPITQALDKVSMEEGLRFILKDAGIENLLLTYDEDKKTAALYDTEIQTGQSAGQPPLRGETRSPVFTTGNQPDPIMRPPAFPAGNQPDPMLSRPATDQGSGPRATPRVRNRRNADPEE